MARLKFRFRFNPGRHGAPLDKLGAFAVQVEKFLRSFSADLGMDVKKGEWVAEDFKDGSFDFTSHHVEPVNPHIYTKGYTALNLVVGDDPLSAVNKGLVSYGTMTEFSRIGKAMDPDEHFDVGLFERDTAAEPEWKSVAYSKTAEIRKLLDTPYISYGSMQGVMHGWTMEGKETSYTVRDLDSGELVKCLYNKDDLHRKVHEATSIPSSVVMVYGDMSWDRATNTILSVDTSDLEVVRLLTNAEFDGLFGAAPNYVGSMTSAEYIEWLRGDDE